MIIVTFDNIISWPTTKISTASDFAGFSTRAIPSVHCFHFYITVVVLYPYVQQYSDKKIPLINDICLFALRSLLM